MLMVRNQAWSPTFKLIKRQSDGLRIELSVIQERQLAKPPELTVEAGETTRKPIWNFNSNEPLPAAGVENDGME